MTTTLDSASPGAPNGEAPKPGAPKWLGGTPIAGSRAFGVLLVLTGAAGLLAAWVITLDEFKLLKNPNFVPGCSLNPVVSCGSVMKSDQAHVFGFSNPMLGLATYPVVMGIGLAILAGAKHQRWYWLGLQAGTLFGVGFVTWLQFESLYRIHALCLWCSLAWVATVIMFWYTLSHNIRNGVIPAPRWMRAFFADFTWILPTLHLAIIALLILTNWWSFWTS